MKKRIEWIDLCKIITMIIVCYDLNPAKRNAIAVKNEMRFSLQKRNVLQKSRLQSFRLSYPVEIQVSFKRLLKTI